MKNCDHTRDLRDRLLKGEEERRVRKENFIFLTKFTWVLTGDMVNSRDRAEKIRDEPVATGRLCFKASWKQAKKIQKPG
jgi:hypothetical protein